MKDITPVFAAIVAFGFTAFSGFLAVPFLHKLKFGQTIREIGPSWHKNKQGTPTMGGLMMMSSVLIALLLCVAYAFIVRGQFYAELHNPKRFAMVLAGVVMAFAMGMVGFADDYIKVVKKRNLGLTAMQKTVLQAVVSGMYLLALAYAGMDETWIPFVGMVPITYGPGLLFWPVAFFFVYGFTLSLIHI